MSQPRPEWTFTNKLGDTITTHDATTALRYQQDQNFTEVETAPVPYDRRRKAELLTEIATRNTGRSDESLLPDTGTIAELAAALDADDLDQPHDPATTGD